MPTFTRAAALTDWLEDEYLSELLLRAIRPKPGRKLPANRVVQFEWGLAGTAEHKLQIYDARAEGVSTWTLDGTWSKDAACELIEIADGPGGVSLVQKAPGTLSLVCAQLTVERGALRRYRPPPAIDPSQLLVWGPREVTWRDLLGWIAAPADHALFRQTPAGNVRVDPSTHGELIRSPYFGPYRVQRDATDEQPWLWLSWMLAITVVGHYVQLRRGTLDDASWARVQRLPARLAPCTVLSGSVRGSGEEWLERWLRSPPARGG